MTTRLERLEAVAAAARTGNARLIELALDDLDSDLPPPHGPAICIDLSGPRFSRADIEDLIAGINAAVADGICIKRPE
jgi:hypothetical protein